MTAEDANKRINVFSALKSAFFILKRLLHDKSFTEMPIYGAVKLLPEIERLLMKGDPESFPEIKFTSIN